MKTINFEKNFFLSDNLKTCNFFNVSMLSLCFLLQFEGVTFETLKLLINIFREKNFFSEKKVNFSEKLKKIDDVVVFLKNTQNEFFLQPGNRNKRF